MLLQQPTITILSAGETVLSWDPLFSDLNLYRISAHCHFRYRVEFLYSLPLLICYYLKPVPYILLPALQLQAIHVLLIGFPICKPNYCFQKEQWFYIPLRPLVDLLLRNPVCQDPSGKLFII